MGQKKISVLILCVLLFSTVSNVQASNENQIVAQFGTGFDEVVIADSSDGLFDPRDLEFHPGRANELWIANRGDDSISIIHNTGLTNQYSENREDSNSNHFLEEVSAIAFGAYHPEFDWQWGSAQETQNTYCGAGTPNQFMGPTLWPSSLSHFAVENQNNGNGLLGSHIDMNHESPDGMGIAHDNGNAYWYFDGYYGELVYYDFQEDHDTGQDDHSDGIVHRYSDVKLTRDAGIPGHMILDKDSGILYISDTGKNRVLWVDTNDDSIATEDIRGDDSQLEELAAYTRKTGIDWGVIDNGLSRPSGIALHEGHLFVSENGNGQISAYDLAEDGKSAVIADVIQTSATFIMGLEIGPNGHLHYVDNGKDQVVRIDPYFDMDADGVLDADDNCPMIANSLQENHEGDNYGDACDNDDDNDGVVDETDDCPIGEIAWISVKALDYDLDGCRDSVEDDDDDNDGILDVDDKCRVGELGWASRSSTDLDSDGCRDKTEDLDDDGDGICDAENSDSQCQVSSMDIDLCTTSPLNFTSTPITDNDRDGCEDLSEDDDDDNDGYIDLVDDCQLINGSSRGELIGCVDSDYDFYADSIDVFPGDGSQWNDSDSDGFGDELLGIDGDYCPLISGTSKIDRLGCLDSDGDGWSDPDENWNINFGADAFIDISSQHFDGDGDGYGDNVTGFQPDACPELAGNSTSDVFGCRDTDGDGYSDLSDAFVNDKTQYSDQDGDGYGDLIQGFEPDSCPTIYGNSTIEELGCLDSDGDGLPDDLDSFPNDITEQFDTDGDGVGDNLDAYPQDSSKSTITDDSNDFSQFMIIGSILSVIIILGLFTMRRKSSLINKSPNNQLILPPLSNIKSHLEPVVQPIVCHGPPLPPEGLPPGWTMEQWSWYGEDYLKNQ